MERNVEALKQLRRVVETAPDHLFHMNSVVHEAPCGTARCTAGWAIIDPWFAENTHINDVIPSDWNQRYFPQEWEDDSFDTKLAKIFGISDSDTRNLFGFDLSFSDNFHAVTKAEVLWNIDQLIEGKEALPYRDTHENVPMYANNVVNKFFE